MSELTETLREEFKDKETRHIYSDEFLNSSIATQIKVLREQRGLTQRELAERAGMRQERISVLEDVNYSSWTINVLRRLAEAFDLTLTVKFESFGEKLFAIEDMSRETLEKPSFDEDPVFQDTVTTNSTWSIAPIIHRGEDASTLRFAVMPSGSSLDMILDSGVNNIRQSARDSEYFQTLREQMEDWLSIWEGGDIHIPSNRIKGESTELVS